MLGTVTLWIGGFDIIYACQDVDFDRQTGLQSIPARFGIPLDSTPFINLSFSYGSATYGTWAIFGIQLALLDRNDCYWYLTDLRTFARQTG